MPTGQPNVDNPSLKLSSDESGYVELITITAELFVDAFFLGYSLLSGHSI